ncbi:delta-type opioid receptor-like [Stegastes partitus]|uniref:Delta-type opioid receptor-like n=1 Tax=Stegastes partitus TaxID=144197 RepID=A0A9Y4U4G4_9TELE|nr:PREDICTED: delta-type opioid receptor-like [Stegastes partitus]
MNGTEGRVLLLLNSTDLEDPMGNSSDTGQGDVERVLVPILDVLILVLGVCGHTLVMMILCGRWRRGVARATQSPQSSRSGTGTDILLLALSVADLILLSMLPFHTVTIAMQHWPFGDVMCRIVGFLGSACTSASVFTLATLAVSRYLTVVKPTRAFSLLTPRRVSVTAALLWLPALCLAAPQLVFRTVGMPRKAPDGLSCFALQSDRDQLIYGLVHFLVAFLFPLVIIAVAYGSIYVFLWGSQQGGRTPQVERYQSKVTQTSAMLVLAFTVCWLPSYGLTLALLANNSSGATGTSPRYGPFSVFARLMATSSTVMNPILYVLMSQKFRQDVLRLFKRDGQRASGAVVMAAV